jgi:tetratricopeptide (TPR) repeat protein
MSARDRERLGAFEGPASTRGAVSEARLDGAVLWVLLGLVLATMVATYRSVAENGFVLDDAHAVASNPSIASLALAGRWFTSPYAASALREHADGYRPILIASYALDQAFWESGPAGFHRTNLIVHAGVVVVVFVLARRLWRNGMAALAATTVMALHPINAEAVNYIAARSSSLTAFFLLAAVWAYDAAIRDDGAPSGPRERFKRAGRFGAALTAGLLALATKEAAAILPLLILAWDRARFGDRTPWRASVIRSLPFWAVTAAFLVVRSAVLGQRPPDPDGGFSIQTALFALKIVLSSFGHWVWPVGLAVDHGWSWTIGSAEAALLLAGAGGAAVGTAVVFRKDRQIGWCLAWFWLALLPLTALPMVSRVTLYQDHRVYLAGIGLSWALGRIVAVAIDALSGRAMRAALAVAAVGVIVAAIRADVARSAVWVDEPRLWEDVLAKYPESVVARNSRGFLFLNAGRLDEAQRDFEATLRLVPGSPEARKNLGLVYAERGEIDRAIREFQAALAVSPRSPGILLELGLVYERAGLWDSAIGAYAQVLDVDPGEALALKGLARGWEREQRFEEAARGYRQALVVDPLDDGSWMALGGILVRLDRWRDAREAFEAVLSRHPHHSQARFNLGAALDGLGDHRGAADAYREAAAGQPHNPEILFRIGTMHARYGRWADAEEAYEQALARDPRHVLSHFNLGQVAERRGDGGRAVSHYRAVAASGNADPDAAALRAEAQRAIDRLERGGR